MGHSYSTKTTFLDKFEKNTGLEITWKVIKEDKFCSLSEYHGGSLGTAIREIKQGGLVNWGDYGKLFN